MTQIVLQTPLGCCGLLREAVSWQLSAKSPSETQREREREGTVFRSLELGNKKHQLEAATDPTVLSRGNRPLGANEELLFSEERPSCVPRRLAIAGQPTAAVSVRAGASASLTRGGPTSSEPS